MNNHRKRLERLERIVAGADSRDAKQAKALGDEIVAAIYDLQNAAFACVQYQGEQPGYEDRLAELSRARVDLLKTINRCWLPFKLADIAVAYGLDGSEASEHLAEIRRRK